MENKKTIDASRLITKSAFARRVKRSPAAIDGRIKRGKLKTVKVIGGELIYLDKND